MTDDRGPWYLLTGLIIGFLLGFIYAWRIDRVEFVDTRPDMLSEAHRDQYRSLIASAYAATGNLVRAEARLALLGDEDPGGALAIQAQEAVVEGRPLEEARALGLLAVAFSQGNAVISSPPQASPTDTAPPPTGTPTTEPSQTASPSETPVLRTQSPTITPLPSRTPTPTAGAPFVVQQEPELVCNPASKNPMIIVEVFDASDQPVPGVEIIVLWEGGEEHFFTGLKPELGLGYADFGMGPGVEYAVRAGGGGELVSGISTAECEDDSGERYWGSWLVQYVQP
ncbi:MAG: hypothetical protein EHM41_15455, partial [Chloroflexi bacterium]